jgi:hypothetical protein
MRRGTRWGMHGVGSGEAAKAGRPGGLPFAAGLSCMGNREQIKYANDAAVALRKAVMLPNNDLFPQ